MAQQVKDLALSLLLWHGFDPLAQKLLHAMGTAKKKKKKVKLQKETQNRMKVPNKQKRSFKYAHTHPLWFG